MPVLLYMKDRNVRDYSPKTHYAGSSKISIIKVKRTGTLYDLEGVPVELFPIRIMAEALDRSPVGIRLAEKMGQLPKAMFAIAGKPHRMYSGAQLVNLNRLMFCKYDGMKYLHDREKFIQFWSDCQAVFYQKDVVVTEDGQIERLT